MFPKHLNMLILHLREEFSSTGPHLPLNMTIKSDHTNPKQIRLITSCQAGCHPHYAPCKIAPFLITL